MVAVSKLWNWASTGPPSFMLLLVSSAGHPCFIPVRCEDLVKVGHTWEMFLAFLSLDSQWELQSYFAPSFCRSVLNKKTSNPQNVLGTALCLNKFMDVCAVADTEQVWEQLLQGSRGRGW